MTILKLNLLFRSQLEERPQELCEIEGATKAYSKWVKLTQGNSKSKKVSQGQRVSCQLHFSCRQISDEDCCNVAKIVWFFEN